MGRVYKHKWNEKENTQGFGGTARRKEPLGRLRRRWTDYIKMDLRQRE